MANQFQITISAVDKATAVVKRVNDSFGRLTRPISQVSSSMSAFSKEAGFDKLGKSIVGVGRAAADTAQSIGRIVAPLAAVAGIGSIAGVAALAREWVNLGAEVKRTATTIGVSTDTLQSLRGAAQLAGVSADALTGGLKSLGTTMEDALYGRNQEAMVMMNRLGITMHKTSTGAVDTTRAFMDLANAIQRNGNNPQVQALIAKTFGLEELLPLLRQGKVSIAELQEQVQRSGAIMSGPAVAAASSFQKSLAYLSLSFDGVKNAIFEELMPVVQPMIDGFREWLIANRSIIATNLKVFVIDVANALKQINWKAVIDGTTAFFKGVNSVVQSIGGWKTAAEGLMIFMGTTWLAGMLLPILRIGKEVAFIVTRLGAVATGVGSAGTAAAAAAAKAGGGIPGGRRVAAGGIGLGAQLFGLMGGAGEIMDSEAEAYKRFGGNTPEFQAWLKKNRADRAQSFGQSMLGWIPGLGGVDWNKPLFGGSSRNAPASSNTPAAVVPGPANAPIGIRQNNPGNLRGWGDMPVVNGFASFPTAKAGLSALAGNLLAYGKQGINSIGGIINKWAPAGDGNNVGSYVADVSKRTGFSADQGLNLKDPATLSALVTAITQHENGQNPYSADQIAQAVAERLGTGQAGQQSDAPGGAANGQQHAVKVEVSFKNAPPGTRTNINTQGSVQAHARIDHAMPTLVAA